jgi:hypothetical protein
MLHSGWPNRWPDVAASALCKAVSRRGEVEMVYLQSVAQTNVPTPNVVSTSWVWSA